MNELRLYMHALKLQLKASRMYRANMWLGFIGILFLYGTQLIVLYTTLHYFNELKGWSSSEVALLFSLFLFSYGLMISIFAGIRDFSQLVRSGQLDIMLVRPHSLIIQVLSGRLELNSWAHLLIGGTVLVYSILQLDIVMSSWKIFQLIQIIIGAACIQTGVLLIWAGLSFKILDTNALQFLGFTINNNYMTYPLSLYNQSIMFLFTFYPMGFISYYPAEWFIGRNSGDSLGKYTFLIGVIFLLVTYSFWLLSSKKYESTGS
ncbi:ABC transporter permease [Paenibacillus sp. FJAT-26967]|uniref:ABC transporter permease n=1 Tax=Paenibacillus sp. FJAT-26967 TaxID=1729690 RepID=UPI000839A654|nr:ABC-2 family transporter protein [Paenibacillus sp. FJAT-26967]